MKQFFENYGAVALGILALIVLIAMITPVGNLVKTSLQGTVQTFSAGIESQTDTMTESMEEAFDNASFVNGVKDSKFYLDGVIFSHFADGTVLSDNKTVSFSDGDYAALFDLNVIQDGVFKADGLNDLTFDVYIDNYLVASNVEDYGGDMDLSKEHTMHVVLKNMPDNLRLASEPKKMTNYEMLRDLDKYSHNWKGGSSNYPNLFITYPIYVETIG